jgi:uncharacterized lipoprotein YddW (UPF0748 family)
LSNTIDLSQNKEKMKQSILLLLLIGFSISLNAKTYPKREMRAIWIATVTNIDWPSSPNLSTDEQKAEMIALLNHVKEYNMNAVVLQIRPASDAFYNSGIEPWSQWLTGKQGVAPDPWYDPLQFTIEECRKRGIDIHVWLNPYRAVHNIEKAKLSPNHIAIKHPEWLVTYGNQQFLDPGIPAVRDYLTKVVGDLVRRYDIDAIHFDDYFYPYKIAGIDFPDNDSFKKFGNNSNGQSKDDWRRNNVDQVIKQLHDTIKSVKPYVEFGIAPFGVWRNKKDDPNGSDTRAGSPCYDDLYADVLKWQNEKWIDYISPQLYWYIGKEVADYAILAKWWAEHSYGCQLYIGHALYTIDPQSKDQAWRTSDEIIKQLNLNKTIPGIRGSMFYSAKFLGKNPLSLKEKLLQGHFAYPALTPENPLIEPIQPVEPANAILQKEGGNVVLSWDKGENNRMFVVYQFKKFQLKKIKRPDKIIYVTSYQKLLLNATDGYKPAKYRYFVTSISPTHKESKPVKFK